MALTPVQSEGGVLRGGWAGCTRPTYAQGLLCGVAGQAWYLLDMLLAALICSGLFF